MNQCQNCGQMNDAVSNFCRFCGVNMVQPQRANDYTPPPPRPYSWKTDEFQVKNQAARKTQNFEQGQQGLPNVMNPPMNRQAMAHPNHAHLQAGYRCPRCGTTNPPYHSRQISTAGWITFAVLLIFTFIFFWIGLLIKEDVQVCSVCGFKIPI